MQLKQLLTDDDAVSPVIGVILMVAITVILAAVIGAFVLGIGGDQESAPQVTWDTSESFADDGSGTDVISEVRFNHNGGDAVQASLLSVAGVGSTTDMGSSPSPDRLTAGTAVVVDFDETGSNAGNTGDTVRIIWSPDGSDDTNVIGTHRLTDQTGDTSINSVSTA